MTRSTLLTQEQPNGPDAYNRTDEDIKAMKIRLKMCSPGNAFKLELYFVNLYNYIYFGTTSCVRKKHFSTYKHSRNLYGQYA